jgi:hypothetical protein
MGRKYRQPGYQSEEQPARERKLQKTRKTSDGPRSPRMPGFQELMRCAMCGFIIPTSLEITGESRCPKCQADLRSCKHCRYFDTGARFECTQPVSVRVMAKDLRNDCEFFLPRTSVERETSSPANGNSMSGPTPRAPKDARSAFDDLFR